MFSEPPRLEAQLGFNMFTPSYIRKYWVNANNSVIGLPSMSLRRETAVVYRFHKIEASCFIFLVPGKLSVSNFPATPPVVY